MGFAWSTGSPTRPSERNVNYALHRAENIHWHLEVTRTVRAHQKHQDPAILWIMGFPVRASLQSQASSNELYTKGFHTYVLDGDNVRHDSIATWASQMLTESKTFGACPTAALMADAGLIVIVASISPFRSERELARKVAGNSNFLEIFLNASLQACEQRDPKGLYRKARSGEIRNFTGIDSEYQAPDSPDIEVNTLTLSPQGLVKKILDLLAAKGITRLVIDRSKT